MDPHNDRKGTQVTVRFLFKTRIPYYNNLIVIGVRTVI